MSKRNSSNSSPSLQHTSLPGQTHGTAHAPLTSGYRITQVPWIKEKGSWTESQKVCFLVPAQRRAEHVTGSLLLHSSWNTCQITVGLKAGCQECSLIQMSFIIYKRNKCVQYMLLFSKTSWPETECSAFPKYYSLQVFLAWVPMSSHYCSHSTWVADSNSYALKTQFFFLFINPQNCVIQTKAWTEYL